jgi:putative ABC transport system ATP-binding protein
MKDSITHSEPVLKTGGVVLAREGKRFARLPDLGLRAGETVGLVGPSGSGKTTALLALAGIRRPAEGLILVEGINPWKMSRSSRDGFRGRRIGLVFQSFHLVDALNVAANVRLAEQCAGYPLREPNRLDSLLARLGLSDLRNRRVDRISHGQAQRVAVARALLNRPAVVLADEPTSALDDAHAASMMALLREAARSENTAMIVATHDRRVLGEMDSVVEMETIP